MTMTVDDIRGYVLYYLADCEIGSAVITDYIYFLNKEIKGLNFKYSLCYGLSSRNLKAYLNSLLELDYISIDNTLELTDFGESKLGEILCDEDSIREILFTIVGTLSQYNQQLIHLASTVDRCMLTKVQKKGIDSMDKSKSAIMESASRFLPMYMSEDNFDNCILLINQLDKNLRMLKHRE